jgi:hypothetical protein
MSKVFLAVLAATLLQSMALSGTASAAIVCKDGYQKSGGNWISTPYCNDAHLAQIARDHGVRVSDAEVRNNPATKDDVCRFVGISGTARDYCPGMGGDDFRGH